MIRGIYPKIFLWFMLATGITSAAIFLITVLTHSQSLGPSWMIGVLDQYARSAVNIYDHGGKAQLAEYLQEIEDASFLQSTLLDPAGHDIVGRGVPPDAEKVLAKARATGETQFHIGLTWTGAAVDDRPDGKYILVAKVLIPHDLILGGALEVTVLQWLLPALAGGLLLPGSFAPSLEPDPHPANRCGQNSGWRSFRSRVSGHRFAQRRIGRPRPGFRPDGRPYSIPPAQTAGAPWGYLSRITISARSPERFPRAHPPWQDRRRRAYASGAAPPRRLDRADPDPDPAADTRRSPS